MTLPSANPLPDASLESTSLESHVCQLGIEAAARAALCASPYLELRRISCTLRDNLLVLRGYVSSYYLRQVAQSLLLHLDGVAVANELEVFTKRDPRERLTFA